MSQLELDVIAEETAALVQSVKIPAAPFGYGTELSCITDFTKNLDAVDPWSKLGIAQALCRRLITPRGQLPGDADYGFDLRGFCNHGVTQGTLRDIGGQVQVECQKDDRVSSVRAIVTVAQSDMTIELYVEAVDPSVGGFDLTLAVTSSQVIIEAINS